MVYIFKRKVANTYEINVAAATAATQKKAVDDEQEMGTTTQQNFCRIGKFLWINRMKNELNDCAMCTDTYIKMYIQQSCVRGDEKFKIFVHSHIKLNWIFSSAKTNRIASLPNEQTLLCPKRRCDAMQCNRNWICSSHFSVKSMHFVQFIYNFFSLLVAMKVNFTQ